MTTTEGVLVSDMDQVQAIGFHYDDELIYYSDTIRGAIYRLDLS